MKNPVEIDVELLDKLKLISTKENISLDNLIELSIINFLIEKGEYGKV